jgi:hypothetical protein
VRRARTTSHPSLYFPASGTRRWVHGKNGAGTCFGRTSRTSCHGSARAPASLVPIGTRPQSSTRSAVISAAGIDRAGQAAGVLSTLDTFGAALGVAVGERSLQRASDNGLSGELSAVGVRIDSQQVDELQHLLGTSEVQGHVKRIVPGDPSAALGAGDAAFMTAFDLVMALSARRLRLGPSCGRHRPPNRTWAATDPRANRNAEPLGRRRE